MQLDKESTDKIDASLTAVFESSQTSTKQEEANKQADVQTNNTTTNEDVDSKPTEEEDKESDVLEMADRAPTKKAPALPKKANVHRPSMGESTLPRAAPNPGNMRVSPCILHLFAHKKRIRI